MIERMELELDRDAFELNPLRFSFEESERERVSGRRGNE
jgi:hypothetical protein